MLDIMKDTLLDSIRMLPFLFAAYLIIEWVEHKTSNHLKNLLSSSGKCGAIGGSILGSFPQCGFSVAAANFYAGKVITKGTLIAVFIATSDEAIPVLLANPGKENTELLFSLIGIKIVIAIIAGLTIDFICNLRNPKEQRCPSAEINAISHHCHSKYGILRATIHHTLSIFFFIIIFSFVLNCIIYLLGDALLAKCLMSDTIFQPIIAGVFGLLPNCAASVILTELYLAGSISFGSIISGLSTGAGIGLAVLFKINKNMKDNFFILLILCSIGIGCGIAIDFFTFII